MDSHPNPRNPPFGAISVRSGGSGGVIRLNVTPPTVLTIAGFDPSSGAGVTADLKVFAAHRLYGLSAITALTVQSTQGVQRSQSVSPQLLTDTLACLAEDLEIAGVKIGMLGSAEAVSVTARFLAGSAILRQHIVLDPIIRSSSGRTLLDADGFRRLRNELLPVVGWVTPNIDELAELTGASILGHDSVVEAARSLRSANPDLNIVITGGHLDPPDDFLLTADGIEQWFPGIKIKTRATHGTGCTFSSALLAQLVSGKPPIESVSWAKEYVRAAMEAAYPIGKGRGPLHHLYELDRDRKS
jgi:hydroxymethylpyrimidine/phosphomethylpyrimidine kinase